MQAAQIDPAKIYAVTINQKIYRFRVRAVESRCFRRKLKPSAADYEHKVHGILDERDFDPGELPNGETERNEYLSRTFDPSEIEDEYERYADLVAKAKAEREQAEADRLARVHASEELTDLFHSLTGLAKTSGYNNPFTFNNYSGSVGISTEGVAALLSVLQNMIKTKMIRMTGQPEPADK